MKWYYSLVLLSCIFCAGTAAPSSSATKSAINDKKQDLESDLKATSSSQLDNEYKRYRKSAGYGGGPIGSAGSIAAPPCPKNYLFSCQPNLAPVPCSAPASSFGTAGAYSAPIPAYVAAFQNTYGLPQSYGGFVPHNFNNVYRN